MSLDKSSSLKLSPKFIPLSHHSATQSAHTSAQPKQAISPSAKGLCLFCNIELKDLYSHCIKRGKHKYLPITSKNTINIYRMGFEMCGCGRVCRSAEAHIIYSLKVGKYCGELPLVVQDYQHPNRQKFNFNAVVSSKDFCPRVHDGAYIASKARLYKTKRALRKQEKFSELFFGNPAYIGSLHEKPYQLDEASNYKMMEEASRFGRNEVKLVESTGSVTRLKYFNPINVEMKNQEQKQNVQLLKQSFFVSCKGSKKLKLSYK